MEKHVALGIDIGGTHITAALINLDNRLLVKKSIVRQPINSNGNKQQIISAWCKIIDESLKDVPKDLRYVGIAMPGPFDYEEGICLIKDQDKFRSLYGVNIKEELANCLGLPKDNLCFLNDAASFLQGEVYAGAAKGKSKVLGLTLGTGLGSAICCDFKSVDADMWNDRFLGGSAEDYFSTRWFIAKYKEVTGKEISGVKQLVNLLKTDNSSQHIFDEFGINLANFLMSVTRRFELDTVVLGGNIAKAYFAFSPMLLNTLKYQNTVLDIRTSTLHERSAIIGAASWCEEHYIVR